MALAREIISIFKTLSTDIEKHWSILKNKIADSMIVSILDPIKGQPYWKP